MHFGLRRPRVACLKGIDHVDSLILASPRNALGGTLLRTLQKGMAWKRYATERIIGVLREADVRLGQGQTAGTICRGLSITEQTYYRWRKRRVSS